MKLRKNRLVALAAIAGTVYLLNRESKKNPELRSTVKNKWENVKSDLGKVVSDTQEQANQVINDFEEEIGDYSGEAFHVAEDVKDDAQDVIESL